MATTTTLTPYSSLTTPFSTPQSTTTPSPARPSPGSWQHPRSAEIALRNSRNTYTPRALRRTLYNALALLILSYIYLALLRPQPYLTFTPLFLIWLVLAYNTLLATMPLWRKPDDLSDIPLTPTQRSLLGLPPSPASSPAGLNGSAIAGAGGGNIITPPRYPPSTTSTPRSRSTSRSRNGTPLSGSRFGMSESIARGLGASTTTPGGLTDRGDSPVHSPLWVKTREMARKGSQGSFRSLRRGDALGGRDSGTGSQGVSGEVRALMDVSRRRDSPNAGNGGRSSSVGLSSKWIYERESRRGSGAYS